MVRTNSLPFRLLCLDYGADLVYTEEIIDYRLCKCKRLENKVLNTVDYIDDQGEVLLRLCPSEKSRLILQIGSNDPERALKAIKIVANDICGVDFNFGCPKSFSISGGMGAALLEKPKEIKALLTKSVQGLNLPVTCKIRILPDLAETLKLVKTIEDCGVSAIAVHGRTKDQRSRSDNQEDVIRRIVDTISIPIIANGGSNLIKTYSDVDKFRERTHASSVMLARCAMRNPSIFKTDNNLEPIKNVVERFLQLAVKYDAYVANVKYPLQTMLTSGHYGSNIVRAFHAASDYSKLCDVFDLSEWYNENRIVLSKSDYYEAKDLENELLERYISDRRVELEPEGITEFVCDTLPYNGRVYGNASPKAQLNDYVNQMQHLKLVRPKIEVFKLDRQRKNQYYCSMIFRNVFYLNKFHSISKKGAEHATSMLVCEKNRLVQLDEYRTKISGCNRNVA